VVRLARLVTEVLAPAPIVAGLMVLVGWHATGGSAAGTAAGLLAAVFASLVPFAFILRGVRRGTLTDHHVRLREQRVVPLLAGLVSVVAGLALLVLLGAPRDVVALLGAGLAGLAVTLLATLRWKVSVHSAVAAGAVVVLAIALDVRWSVLGVLVAVIGWARVAVGDHTPAQVLAGAGLGSTVAAVVFPLLR
jgi:membrane-associated phospholipid phosphatase